MPPAIVNSPEAELKISYSREMADSAVPASGGATSGRQPAKELITSEAFSFTSKYWLTVSIRYFTSSAEAWTSSSR
ncbi:hypothetical protein D3C78_1736280 [compost metagenome]